MFSSTTSRFTLFICFGLFLVILAVLIRFFIFQDYTVFAYVPCDPVTESCFVFDDGAGEYYTKIVIAEEGQIPVCNADYCPELSCDGIENCRTLECGESHEFDFYTGETTCDSQ